MDKNRKHFLASTTIGGTKNPRSLFKIINPVNPVILSKRIVTLSYDPIDKYENPEKSIKFKILDEERNQNCLNH